MFVSCCFHFPWKRKPALLGHCLRRTVFIASQGEVGCWWWVRSEVLFLLVEISRRISSSHSFLVGQQVKLGWVAGHQHWRPAWIPEQRELADKGKDHVGLVSRSFTSGGAKQFLVRHQLAVEAPPLVAPYSRDWLCWRQWEVSRAGNYILYSRGGTGNWRQKCLGICQSLL